MEKLEKTAAALRRRGFEAVVFETAKEAADYLLSDMPAGETVGFGGCMTAKQMGLETLLRAAGHKVLWHWEAEPAERPALLHEAMNAPLYVCSANAVTACTVLLSPCISSMISSYLYGSENHSSWYPISTLLKSNSSLGAYTPSTTMIYPISENCLSTGSFTGL